MKEQEKIIGIDQVIDELGIELFNGHMPKGQRQQRVVEKILNRQRVVEKQIQAELLTARAATNKANERVIEYQETNKQLEHELRILRFNALLADIHIGDKDKSALLAVVDGDSKIKALEAAEAS